MAVETLFARREIDEQEYGRLLVKTLPRVIQTEAENERMLGIADKLMSKGEENLTPEKDVLLELVTTLIEQFARAVYLAGSNRAARWRCTLHSACFVIGVLEPICAQLHV